MIGVRERERGERESEWERGLFVIVFCCVVVDYFFIIVYNGYFCVCIFSKGFVFYFINIILLGVVVNS